MPPSAKFTREEIIGAALAIVRRKGMPALTARALGAELESSARPIFTVFKNMEEVQQAVLGSARAEYNVYIEKGLSEQLPFKGVGTQYIRFAVQEPRLFRLLFMSEKDSELACILPLLDGNYQAILSSITDEYGVEVNEAEALYRHMWIYTHGIAALCATGTCRFTENETSSMLTEVFTSLLDKIKRR